MVSAPIKSAPSEERTPWPPRDYLEKRTVTSADSWWTLQTEYGRADPWDIIVYNFNTTLPAQVNWYLHHKLGCTLMTADRANYRFGFGDPKNPTRELPAPPGKSLDIYIPHPKWKPPNLSDEMLRETVIRTLRSAYGLKSFWLGDLSLTGADFRAVVEKILSREIDVRYRPGISVDAGYLADPMGGVPGNCFEFRFPLPRSEGEHALIVHEGVHAALDVRKEAGITTEQDEGLAFVAQSLWVLQRQGLDGGPLKTGPGGTAMEDKILDVAWNIAISIDGGGEPLAEDIEDLEWLISQDPIYGRKPDPVYKGV